MSTTAPPVTEALHASPLRIVITTTEEPVVVNGFVQALIESRAADIAALILVSRRQSYSEVMSKRPPAKGKNTQPLQRWVVSLPRRASGALAILLIYGVRPVVSQALRLLQFHLRFRLHAWGLLKQSPSIAAVAARHGVRVLHGSGVNDPALRAQLQELAPDVIINQAPGILRREFLQIPRLGVLNRHNSLLPRNRGRLSTFWALYHGDAETGVTAHLVVESLDAGPIVAQQRVAIRPGESVAQLAARCYALAPAVMLKALDRLARGETRHLPNRDEDASYNSNPTLAEAWRFRWRRWTGLTAGAPRAN